MISESEDLLIADLAQAYGVIDYKAVPPDVLAALTAGLPDESRVKMHYTKRRASFSQLLMAMAIDALNTLIWQNTKNGHKGRKHPKSLYKLLTAPDKKEELEAFDSVEAYEKWHAGKEGENDG